MGLGGRPPRIGIVVGEASGDQLGSHLMRAVTAAFPGAVFFGIGGPKMQGLGMDVWFPMEKLAVRGFVEVLKHYWEIVGIRRKLGARLRREKPDLFVGIDAPAFNLALETRLKKAGIPTIHYVCPQFWAWDRGRLPRIRRAVSRILALFPFEVPMLEEAGIPATFVGHPMADQLPEEPDRDGMREQMRLPKKGLVIAMLPGSRQVEVKAMAGLFVKTARQILEQKPLAQFLVPLVSRETRILFEHALYHDAPDGLPLTILYGHAHDAMTAADAVLVASGTATLEAALLKRPMVITYKLPRVTYWIAKRRIYLPYVGLPNVLAGEFIVPEFLQDAATPAALSEAIVRLLDDEDGRKKLQARFLDLHQSLKQESAQKVVEAIALVLGEGVPAPAPPRSLAAEAT
ncbi:MAG: lipid-A-disaccharide synthase [Burkholderiales bacterium]|jgi:lipid-A-disaccharide synthase